VRGLNTLTLGSRGRQLLGGLAVTATLTVLLSIGAANPTPSEAQASTPPSTAVSTAVATSTPTNTPVPLATPSATVVPVTVLTAIPTPPAGSNEVIPTPNASTGGVAALVPTAPAGVTNAVAVVGTGSNSPFRAEVQVPVSAGGAPVGIVIQPSTTLPSTARVPSGVATSKVIEITVFDPVTGVVQHSHNPPLVVNFVLSASERALCRANPAKLGLLHLRSDGTLERLPVTADCAAGIATARIYETTSFAIAELTDSTSVTFNLNLPRVFRRASGW
jgi:hypothetical protein